MKKFEPPTITETVEWIEKNHFETCGSDQTAKLRPWCGLCGGTWPCASTRMAREIRRLWRKLKK